MRYFGSILCLACLTIAGCSENASPGSPAPQGEYAKEAVVSQTATAPAGITEERLNQVYKSWVATAKGRQGFLYSNLFRIEGDPNQPTRYQFSLTFRGP